MAESYRFLVVGTGGIGSSLSEDLAKMLEYGAPGSMLIMIDGDTFEPKNNERQVFREFGNKAEVRAAELTPYYPKTFIAPIPKWVVETIESGSEEDDGKITAEQLLQEKDVVFAVVDNFKCRKLLLDVASKLDNVDVFLGGNTEGLDGSIYHYQRRDGKDITDNPGDSRPELINPTDRNPGELSCEERSMLEGGSQILASNRMVAALLLGRVHHCILEGNLPVESETFFDLELGLAASYNRLAEDAVQDLKVISKGGAN